MRSLDQGRDLTAHLKRQVIDTFPGDDRHDPVEVARFADRLLLMRDGRIEPAPQVTGRGEEISQDALQGMGRARMAGLALAALAAGLEPVKLSKG